jgi:hypothetical protein
MEGDGPVHFKMDKVEVHKNQYGHGIYAKEFIPAGTVWWKEQVGINVLLVSRNQYKTLCDSERDSEISPYSHALWDMISNFCPYCSDRDSLVLIMDNGRYVNHSDEPNSRWKDGVCVALRDIAPGEEIFENYNAYDKYCWPEPWDDFSEDVINSVDESLRQAYAAAHPDSESEFSACSKLGCYVSMSDTEAKGMGLFLDKDVKAGEILWSEHESVWRIPQAAWETFASSCVSESSLARSFYQAILSYGYYDARSNSLIVTLDNGRFKNHSRNPTGKTVRIHGLLHTIATRDLKAGTEIEEDYNAYDVCPFEGVTFHWENILDGYKQN